MVTERIDTVDVDVLVLEYFAVGECIAAVLRCVFHCVVLSFICKVFGKIL